MSTLAGQARRALLEDGKPVILIGGDYGITSQMAFHLAEARQAMQADPIVFCRSTDRPRSQFDFWPGYSALKGANAIYVAPRRLRTSWTEFVKDPKGRQLKQRLPPPQTPPARVRAEFETVTSLGVFPVPARGWPQHWVELYACRGLR